MTSIQTNLPAFIECLEKRDFVLCDSTKLIWSTQPRWMGKVYQFLRFNDDRIANIGKTFCNYMDFVEKTPVVFSGITEIADKQSKLFAEILRAAEVVKSTLDQSNSRAVNKQALLLAQKVAAFRYRIEGVNGGKDISDVDGKLFDKITDLASRWKGKMPLFTDKQVTPHELLKIARACQYADFCSVLLADKSLQDRFFSWSLRDNMDVDHFIQFPATTARVKAAFLATRLGRLCSDMFRLNKVPVNEGLQKVLELPFDIGDRVKYINILDESAEVNLHGTWMLTIKKILDEFSSKNKAVGDFEMFKSTGITIWNAFELGRWNPAMKHYDHVDLTKTEWWLDLPILEELKKEELEHKYEVTLKEGQWLVCAKAGRQSPDLDLNNTHGFLELAIPTENGNYRTFPFGNFASPFPQSVQELILFIGDTREGKISYPDENVFYSHRQIASLPIVISEKQGRQIMRSIQKDLIKSRFGINIFQFAGDNCACWAQTKLEDSGEAIPNIYKIKFSKSEPHNPALALLFNAVKIAPLALQPKLFGGLYTLFGGWRTYEVFENGKRVYKCQYDSTSCKEATLYHPGNLHELILNGKLKGVVTTGHR